jgi:hypothetical protein
VNNNTNRCFVLNDILRSHLGYLGYTLFTGILMHNSFAFYDGRLSIKKGFTYKELDKYVSEIKDRSNEIKIKVLKPSRLVIIGNK